MSPHAFSFPFLCDLSWDTGPGCDPEGPSDAIPSISCAHKVVSPPPLPRQQQQRNRLGSGGSGDGPSLSWSRQTRPPAAVSGRGDAADRFRNRSSSGNWVAVRGAGRWAGRLRRVSAEGLAYSLLPTLVDSFRSRCSSASSCSELEDFSESLPRG